VVNRARKLAKNVPKTVKADPTLQRDIAELIEELQATYGGRAGLRRTFSTDPCKSRCSEASFLEFRDGTNSKNKFARSSTHTGMGVNDDDDITTLNELNDSMDSDLTSLPKSQASTLDSLPSMGNPTFGSLPPFVDTDVSHGSPNNSISLSQASTQAASANMERSKNGTTNSRKAASDAAGEYCGEFQRSLYEEAPAPELRQIAVDLEDLPEVPVPMIPTRNHTNHRRKGTTDPTEAKMAR
jgi:hypothetical protein